MRGNFFFVPKVLSAIGSEVSEVLMWDSMLGTPVFFLTLFSSSCITFQVVLLDMLRNGKLQAALNIFVDALVPCSYKSFQVCFMLMAVW